MTPAPGKLAAALLMTVLALPSLSHAVPQQLAQQGRLTDLDDVPLEGSHELTFRIYTDLDAGVEVWSETLSAEFDRGFYSVILGTDTSGNPLHELLPMAPPLYLELSVDGGAPLLPRQPLLAVPYAVAAGSARNVDGGYVDASEITVAGSTIVDSAGNWTGPTPSVDWSEITGIPSGLGDGSNSDTLAGLSCANEDRPVWSAAQNQWACTSATVDLSRIDTSTAGTGQVLTYNGAQLGWEDPSSAQGSPCSLVQTAGNYAELDCNGTDVLIKGRNRYSSVGDSASSYTCAPLVSGSVACWGNLPDSMASFPSGSFSQIAVSPNHGCAIDSAGDVSCWGQNSNGESNPQQGPFVDIAAIAYATCAITTTGAIQCWGDSTRFSGMPTTGVFSFLEGNDNAFCALNAGGTPVCWGSHSWHVAQFGSGVTNLTQLDIGQYVSCGVDSNGSVECWGDGGTQGVVSGVPSGTFIKAVSSGYYTACALNTAGDVTCWGLCNDSKCTPQVGLSFDDITAGPDHLCGLVSGIGAIHCWGASPLSNSVP